MLIGLFGLLVVCIIVYIIVCVVLIGMMLYYLLGIDKLVVIVLEFYLILFWFKMFVEVGVIVGLFLVVLVMMMG